MTEPRLYIIMREDLWDMNPGKGMAQAAHAQADFTAYINRLAWDEKIDTEIIAAWQEDRNFGVTLVLHAPLRQMEEIHTNVSHSGMTVDPTYPYRNYYGKVFVREEITCMWAFVWEDSELEYMRKFPLHS